MKTTIEKLYDYQEEFLTLDEQHEFQDEIKAAVCNHRMEEVRGLVRFNRCPFCRHQFWDHLPECETVQSGISELTCAAEHKLLILKRLLNSAFKFPSELP